MPNSHEGERSSMLKPVQVGLIGCGTVATERAKHAYPALQDLGQIIATYDPIQERAEVLAEHCRQSGSDCRAYGDLDTLLSDDRLDAVDICSPHPAHVDPAIAAASAGKHVLVEKPLATTLEDGKSMLAAAQRAGIILCVNEQLRVQEPVVRARDMILAGEIGKPAVIRAHRIGYLEERWMAHGWRQDAALAGGGMLLDQGPHYFAMLRVLAGPVAGEVTHVSTMATTVREDWRAEDTAVVSLRFKSGLLGEALYCWATRTSQRGAVGSIYGTRGSLEIISPEAGLILHRADLPKGRQVIISNDDYDHSYNGSIADFLRAVRGEQPARITGEEGLQDLAVVEACYRSWQSGRVEQVESTL